MPILIENAFVRVTYYPDQRLIENTVLLTSYGAEFRAGCDYILRLAQELRPRLWLNDNRLLGALATADLTWLAEDFMLRFAALGVNRSATVHSTERQSNLMVDGMLDHATPHISWQERAFPTYDAAWSWLMKAAAVDQLAWMLEAG